MSKVKSLKVNYMRKILPILLLLFIASCSKDDDVAVSNAPIAGTLNKTITITYKVDFETQLNNPYDTIVTLYDNGRIKSVESKKNYFFNKAYSYDNQGRLIKYNTYGQSVMIPIGVSSSSFLEYRFFYENGHVSGIEEYVSTASGQIKYFFENYKFENDKLTSTPKEGWPQKVFNFNDKGQLIKYQRIFNSSINEDTFEYDSNGNVMVYNTLITDKPQKVNFQFLEGKNPELITSKYNFEAFTILQALNVNRGLGETFLMTYINNNFVDDNLTTYVPNIKFITTKVEYLHNQDKYPKNKKYFYKSNDKMIIGHTIDYFYN